METDVLLSERRGLSDGAHVHAGGQSEKKGFETVSGKKRYKVVQRNLEQIKGADASKELLKVLV